MIHTRNVGFLEIFREKIKCLSNRMKSLGMSGRWGWGWRSWDLKGCLFSFLRTHSTEGGQGTETSRINVLSEQGPGYYGDWLKNMAVPPQVIGEVDAWNSAAVLLWSSLLLFLSLDPCLPLPSHSLLSRVVPASFPLLYL